MGGVGVGVIVAVAIIWVGVEGNTPVSVGAGTALLGVIPGVTVRVISGLTIGELVKVGDA